MSNRLLSVSMAVALAAGLVACGSSGGSPTDPSGGSPATGATPSAGGATVRGVVETPGTAGASSGEVHAFAAANGVRVSVVGTSLSTTTDDRGQFEIRGVPSGRVELRFEAPGIDVRLEIESLAEGQSLNLNVHVSSAGAFLAETEDHRNETTLRGRIDALNGNRMTVIGRSVLTDGLTEFLGRGNAKIALGDLRVGQTAEIEGTSQADGSLYARKVKVEDSAGDNSPGGGDDSPAGQVNFVGIIQGLGPLVVGGQSVVTDSSTRVLDRTNNPIGLSALKVGDKVEVEGARRSDGSVLASKIKLQD